MNIHNFAFLCNRTRMSSIPYTFSMFLLAVALWIAGDLPPVVIADVGAHPTIAGMVFAATEDGVYRSSDSGLRWQRVSDARLHMLGSIPPHAIAFNPFDSRELCILGDSVTSCSDDLGATWRAIPQPGISFLLFDPRISGRLITAAPYGDSWLLISVDHGKTWETRGSLPPHPWFHSAAAIDSATGLIYEDASPHGLCIPSCGVFVSSDDGESWSEIVSEEASWTLAGQTLITAGVDGTIRVGSDARGRLPAAPRVLASHASLLYAGVNETLFLSSDHGFTWTAITQFTGAIEHIAIGSDGAVYVATSTTVFTSSGGRRRAARSQRMSRVEPNEQSPKREAKEDQRPSRAEGDERTIDEALTRQEEKRPED
jgi:hypothetical protein